MSPESPRRMHLGRWWIVLPGNFSVRRRLGRLPRRATAGLLAGGAALATVVAALGFHTAVAGDDDLVGEPVSAEQFAAIAAAAQSCPMLTSARVAGQLMAESGLDAAAAVTTSGGQGIAGLDERDWQEWAPWPAAQRTDMAANVIALARQMCQLGGKLRVAEVPGDRWRLALAAFHTGLDSVTVAGGVPDRALGYIGAASGYAAYYSQLPQFAGAGEAPADPARQPKAIPEGYVDLIVAAGTVCAPVTAPAIAAQLMALSGFDANLRGEDGREGIAQFRPELWQQYGSADVAALVPAAAIPALGTAMCALVDEFADIDGGDPYELALAAYHRGVDAVRDTDVPLGKQTEDLVAAVRRLTDFYAMDGRIASESPSLSASPSTSLSAPPVVSPSGSTSPPTPETAPRPGAGATTPARGDTAPPPDTRATNNPPPKQTTPAAPPAPVRPSNMRQLVGKETGLCVSAGAGSDGTRLTLQRCAENKSQWWEIRGDGTIRANGLCMDVAWGAGEDGTAVQVAYCSGNPAQNWQKWQGRSGTLVNPLTGKCLDVDGHGVGAPLMIWYCVGHAKQTFDAR